MKKILLPLIVLMASAHTALAVDDNTVEIAYNGTSATVTVAKNISSYITDNSTGSHVKLVQAATFAGNSTGEITYVLSGKSADGEFYLEGSYKCTVALNGLTLTNPSGPAINIQNGKRIDVSVKNGTTNTITDGPNEDYNGCFHSKGHTEFKGKGTLNVVGRSRHGIYSKEYMELKNCTVNITAAPKDGIHCKEYFLMESGTITISGAEDDGIQVEQDTKITVTGQTTGHEDENSGNFYMEDGTLNVAVLDYGGQHVKADGTITYGGGKHNFTTTTTAISDLNSDNGQPSGDRVLYDLNGRRLLPADGTLRRGIYLTPQGRKLVR